MSIQYTTLSNLLASPFQRLTSAMWNTAVLTLAEIYANGTLVDRQLIRNNNLYVPNGIFALVGDFYDEVYVSGQPVITEKDPIYIAGFVGPAIQQIQAILYSQLQLYDAIVGMPYDVYSAIAKITTRLITQTRNALQQEITNVYENIYSVTAKLTNQIVTGLSNAVYSVADALLYALTYIYLAMNSLTNAINKLTLYMSPPAIQGLQLKVDTTPQPIYSGPALETVKIILQNLSNYIVYIGNKLYNNFPILPGDILEFSVNNPSNVYAWATGPCTVYALFETL